VDLALYSLSWLEAGDAGAGRALDVLLGLHAASLDRGFVDAVTDETALPAEAAAALDELTRRAHAQAALRLPKRSLVGRLLPDLARDPLLAVELDLGNEADLRLFRDFALFSTGAVVFLRDDDEPEIEIYDAGQSLTFFADQTVLEALVTTGGIPPDALERVL
jgi:hypothetical protein